ncbi:MAG: threonine--tRNA ligase [Planctomycetaceae bacterium]|jgi:threonyl-tRNA synthetase|nr:threonine--tRNA ligase [Planctomycetaceae bacterium]
MLKVILPDGSVREYSGRVTVYDVAREIGAGLARAMVAAAVDGKIVDADFQLPDNTSVQLRILTKKDPETLNILRHSAAHLMARAVMRLYDNVQLAFGPTVENGFYYDFLLEHHLTEDDFPKIEAEIQRLIKLGDSFERIEYPRESAITILKDIGQTLKAEHLEEGLVDQQSVSFYRQGEFIDLCRGPHIPNPQFIGAFKLQSVAGAYWKGDAAKQQLQRLYGTAFFDKKELDEYLNRIEEAKKRDHRVLGKQHELFAIDSRVGQGLILWLPKGAVIRRQLENFIMEELTKRGYTTVNTPVIGNIELYKMSGHYPYYADSQFPPIKMQDGDEFLLRAMNCPHHVMVYSQKPRSYRDLPVRIAEFGCVHRFEQSGELNGMTRVRGFTQDDAHIFCMPEQVEDEFRSCIDMTLTVLKTIGFNDFEVRLSFRDWVSDKYVGNAENWKIAQASLEKVCREMQLPSLEIVEGEAAFYGPKADFVVRDCLGRKWQLGTVQLDYNLPSPERFNLEYIGSDNKPHTPVMIHRAPLGSFERFCGILIEHFGAAFPLWLSPEQLRILTVSEKFNDYAKSLEQKFLAQNIRVTTDLRNEKIGAKIREGRLDLIPYLAVVGAKESESNTLALRSRKEGELGEIVVETVIEKLLEEIKTRKL